MIQQIPSSNLFMVVVDNKCDCSMFEPITMDPIEIMYILYWLKADMRTVSVGILTEHLGQLFYILLKNIKGAQESLI